PPRSSQGPVVRSQTLTPLRFPAMMEECNCVAPALAGTSLMEHRLGLGHFYGQVVKRCTVGGLLLTETHYSPGVHLPRHAHENAYFCLVRRGTYVEQFGGRTRVCGPLTVAFHPP